MTLFQLHSKFEHIPRLLVLFDTKVRGTAFEREDDADTFRRQFID